MSCHDGRAVGLGETLPATAKEKPPKMPVIATVLLKLYLCQTRQRYDWFTRQSDLFMCLCTVNVSAAKPEAAEVRMSELRVPVQLMWIMDIYLYTWTFAQSNKANWVCDVNDNSCPARCKFTATLLYPCVNTANKYISMEQSTSAFTLLSFDHT